METLLSNKFKIARESMEYSQTMAAKQSGWAQARISLLEAGVKDYVLPKYLSWLAKEKINLNAIYDDSVTVEDFEAICAGKVTLALPAHATSEPCELCKAKDHEIGLLNNTIKIQGQFIETLRQGSEKNS